MSSEENHRSDQANKFQIEILTLLNEGVLGNEDLIEDYVEIYSSLREELSKTENQNDSLSQRRIYHRFLKDWHRRMKIPGSEWSKLLVPRALFSLGWNYEKSATALGLSDSKVRFWALRAIQDKVGNFPAHLDKGCARNDLYMVDVLMGQQWGDSLKIYRPQDFQEHLKLCSRCSGIFKSAKEAVLFWKNAAIRTVPAEVEMILKSQPTTYGRGMSAFYHRLGWFNKLGLQIFASAAVLAAVLLVPFYQKIDVGSFFRKSGPMTLAQNNTEHLPESDEPVSTEYAAKKSGDPLEGMIAANDAGNDEVNSEAADTSTEFKAPLIPESPTTPLVAENKKPTLPLLTVPEVKAPLVVPAPTVVPVPVVVAKIPVTPTKPKPPEVAVASKPEPTLLPPNPLDLEKPARGSEAVALSGKHYFYRWGARSDDPDVVSPTIKKILEKYKAMKAGELDLGAEYRGGRYFHFNVTQADYEAVVSEVREVQLVDFSATRTLSDRKDENGKIRIVFWVGPTKL